VSFGGPAGYLGGVGSGVDAELGCAQVHGFVHVAVVGAGLDAAGFGEEVGAALGDVGEFGDGGVVLAGSGWWAWRRAVPVRRAMVMRSAGVSAIVPS
jgi:hypothetical protein